ncbi:cation:proton antiporter [Arcticibacterium luteifluviistationis]|uniref:Sodium:proton antiporter n=1 Tax=Arcticibacterium luteifluviistationis TaxID=1784714 RepID=A0A2Z4GA67_9BACT|nr:cation:proton antiporter [Arcticibacterium luteifluviistationis]AWV97980.1 sodium:proton antiporter [Arcticibacterium luteifluviistationis]
MTTAILITFCSLLLIAYLFDITSARTKIPSVIMLLLLGWGMKEVTVFLGFSLVDFSTLLPVLATIGLILIVLEGSLELKLNSSKIGLLKKSVLGALIPMISLSFILAYAFHYFGDFPFKVSLINAIPLCVISSAIAIPSVINLDDGEKEFVVYESSFSDILGILFFNFIALNETIGLLSVVNFGLHMLIMLVVSVLGTIGLSLLLSRIDHHVKFVPIILLIVLVYAILKSYHLPALLFILLFGLAIGNLKQFEKINWFKKLKTDNLKKEIKRFEEITIEGAFLVRALFFIIFGYMIKTSEILNTDTIFWALGIVILVFFIRAVQLKVSRFDLRPLVYIAPRGLITILLFISIEPENTITLVNNSLIIQVIILTAIIMGMGLMAKPKPPKIEE